MGNVSMINGHIDNVVSDEEIVKALECAIAKRQTNGINDEWVLHLSRETTKTILDLINRLKADKEALIVGQESLMKHLERKKEIITELDNEVERLQKENNLYSDLAKMGNALKAEAIKEFAEKIYRFFCKTSNWNNLKSAVRFNGECDWLKENLDNLVKETTKSDSNDKAFWEDTN